MRLTSYSPHAGDTLSGRIIDLVVPGGSWEGVAGMGM